MVPGPEVLGRGVVVGAGARAPVPWHDAPRVRIDADAVASPAAAVSALHGHWARRRPVVIEVVVDPATFRAPEEVNRPVWELEPGLELFGDRLHFLVWANTYDARGGEPVWWWGMKAARLGGEVATDKSGDVVLPDGTRVWVDGGPREPLDASALDGLPVIHRDSVELGRLSIAPSPSEPTADLAGDQRAAVAHRSGPARIIAPAGSGKTRVLTERLRHLLADRDWEPEVVLAVAYNVRARDELVKRTTGLGARVQTLNGLAHSLLTAHRGRPPQVLDEREVRRIIDGLAPRRRHRANTDPTAAYLEALTQVRLGLRDPDDVEDERGDVPGFGGMVEPYRAELARRGVVDFDEQVASAVDALVGDGPFRRRMQARHRHLLVDELQDLTPAHVLMVRMLAAPAFDVFGVGDDDQVIYGHAGADPRFLVDFESYFPGATSHPLEVNYRCPQEVVEGAARLVAVNRSRVPKDIRSGPDADPGPDALAITAHPPDGGATAVVDVIRRWTDDGVAPVDMAVLTRVHALLLAPHVALVEAGLPVRSTIGPEILDRTGVRAALAYLRIALSPDAVEPDDLTEVYRRPSRGLPRWITKWFRRTMAIEELDAMADRIDDAKVGDKVTSLAADLGRVSAAGRGGTVRDVLVAVRDDIGLGEAMAQLDRSKGGEGSSQLDDVEALIQVADLHHDPAGFEAWLRKGLRPAHDAGGITLSTVHRVKGREWDRVVLAGVSAGLLPHRLAADIEEERRVLHVAVTRARHRAVVLTDASRPSSFLVELDPTAPPSAEPAARRTVAVPGSASRPRGEGGRAAAGRPLTGGAAAREQALRDWRRDRSRTDSVPAYVVASDATLRAIAERAPANPADLARVPGIGPAKLERYGQAILALVSGPSDGGDAEPD